MISGNGNYIDNDEPPAKTILLEKLKLSKDKLKQLKFITNLMI